MSSNTLAGELWEFLKVRKAWWITPIIVMLVLVAVLVILGQTGGSASPFIYALF